MLFTDSFGSRLLSCNIPSLTVQNWMKNPVVQNKCIFDHMYALEAEECIMKAESLICKSTIGFIFYLIVIILLTFCILFFVLFFVSVCNGQKGQSGKSSES